MGRLFCYKIYAVMKYLLLIFLLISTTALAEDVYQQPEAFIAESFDGNAPKPKSFKVPESLNPSIHDIMEHSYKLPKVNYWEKDGRTVWILEEIGKVRPITAGYVIAADNSIERMKVLIYRESHGWEVKHDFFTDQFNGLALEEDNRLDGYVDNISGATMSVDALRNLGKLALFLHSHRSLKE